MASTAFYSNSRIKVIPSFLLHLPYAISRRFFGHQTMGYLHFNIVCDKIFYHLLFGFLTGTAPCNPMKRSFFGKTHSVFPPIVPGIAVRLSFE
jgi:hypothetical protein